MHAEYAGFVLMLLTHTEPRAIMIE